MSTISSVLARLRAEMARANVDHGAAMMRAVSLAEEEIRSQVSLDALAITRDTDARVELAARELADAEAARDRYWCLVLDLRVRLEIARAALSRAVEDTATVGTDSGIPHVAALCRSALQRSAEPPKVNDASAERDKRR